MELESLTPEVWEQLTAKLPRSGKMAPTEQLTCGRKAEILVCVCASRDGAFHLMLDLPPRTTDTLQPSRFAGLSVGRLDDHFVQNYGRRNLIDVRCSTRPHLPAFTAIVKEIGNLVLRNRIDAVVAVNQTVRKWKSFWGKPNPGILSEEEQLGLLAELLVLEQVSERIGPRVVDSWKGPLGYRHDFVIDHFALEVKATLSPKRCHLINGLDQLVPVAGSQLFLVSFLGSRVLKGGVSLPDSVKTIEITLQHYPQEFEVFQQRLSAARYSPAHYALYDETRFSLTTGRLFKVSGEFPRLTPDLLRRPVSPRIVSVVYSLNLDGLPSLKFDTWSRRAFRVRSGAAKT